MTTPSNENIPPKPPLPTAETKLTVTSEKPETKAKTVTYTKSAFALILASTFLTGIILGVVGGINVGTHEAKNASSYSKIAKHGSEREQYGEHKKDAREHKKEGHRNWGEDRKDIDPQQDKSAPVPEEETEQP